jgi:membrane-associated phospholipid phosphatase
MERLNEQGINTVLSLQRFDKLTGAMRFFSVFGDDSFFMFLIAVGYWLGDTALATQLATALALSTAFAGLLKLALRQPRPYWLDERVRPFSRSHEYGLPSRHVLNATLTFGILLGGVGADWLPVALVGTVVLIILVAISRMYIGVHFPLDVVTGFGLGLVGLWLYWQWAGGLNANWTALSLWPQMGVSLLASAAYLGAVLVILKASAESSDPAGWRATASTGRKKPVLSPRNLTYHVATAGGILGLGVALALSAQWPWKSMLYVVPPWAFIARLVIGLVGAAALWFGLEAVPLNREHWAAHVYGYFQHALVTLWLFFLAPVVFELLRV